MIVQIITAILRALLPALLQASRPVLVEPTAPGLIEEKLVAQLRREGWLE